MGGGYSYSLTFKNTSLYPAVVLGNGEGDCKDFGVLMASVIEAGNTDANYGMKAQFMYVDAFNLTTPHKINHLMLNIIFKNGTNRIIDTTNILNSTPYLPTIYGYNFNLTCNATAC